MKKPERAGLFSATSRLIHRPIGAVAFGAALDTCSVNNPVPEVMASFDLSVDGPVAGYEWSKGRMLGATRQ